MLAADNFPRSCRIRSEWATGPDFHALSIPDMMVFPVLCGH